MDKSPTFVCTTQIVHAQKVLKSPVGLLVAVDPPTKRLTFWGLSETHLDFPKSESLQIQPNSSQGLRD